jgi:hypothetical protein
MAEAVCGVFSLCLWILAYCVARGAVLYLFQAQELEIARLSIGGDSGNPEIRYARPGGYFGVGWVVLVVMKSAAVWLWFLCNVYFAEWVG